MYLWREQFHHTKTKRAILATPGGGAMLKACVAHGVKALVIVKNDAHMKHLRDYAIEFMLNEAKMNSACAYHVNRKAVISKLGLDVIEDHVIVDLVGVDVLEDGVAEVGMVL